MPSVAPVTPSPITAARQTRLAPRLPESQQMKLWMAFGTSSRLQDIAVAEGAFQSGLHLHVAELADGEIQVLHGLGPLVGVVLQQQLAKLKAGQGYLGPEAYLACRLDRPVDSTAGPCPARPAAQPPRPVVERGRWTRSPRCSDSPRGPAVPTGPRTAPCPALASQSQMGAHRHRAVSVVSGQTPESTWDETSQSVWVQSLSTTRAVPGETDPSPLAAFSRWHGRRGSFQHQKHRYSHPRGSVTNIDD